MSGKRIVYQVDDRPKDKTFNELYRDRLQDAVDEYFLDKEDKHLFKFDIWSNNRVYIKPSKEVHGRLEGNVIEKIEEDVQIILSRMADEDFCKYYQDMRKWAKGE